MIKSRRVLCVIAGNEGAEERARLRACTEGLPSEDVWFVGAKSVAELNSSHQKVLRPPKLFRRKRLRPVYAFFVMPFIVLTQAIRSRPDAVISFGAQATLVSFPAALLVRAPLTLFLSKVPWLAGARKSQWLWRQGVTYLRDCFALLAAEHVVVPTELMKQAVIDEVSFIKHYIEVLPCSLFRPPRTISAEERIERKATAITTYNFPDAAFIVLTELELEQREPLEGLLHAIAAIDDESLCLLILGEGKERVTLASIAAGLGMPDRVVFLPDEELPVEVYEGIDLVLLLQERGMSLPMLQGLRSSIPVLGTLSGSLPEVLGATPLLIAPNDAEALVQRLKSLLYSRDALRQARELSEAAAKKYSFNWSEKALEIAFRSR